MNKFKYVFIFGLAIIAFVAIMIINYAIPSRTVDFSGEILDVVISDNGKITLHASATFGGDFLFKIDEKSKLKNCCGETISTEELKEGSLIQINYRKYLFKDEKIHTVKELQIFG